MESITKKRNYNIDIFINIKNKRREASFIPEGFTGAENPCEKRTLCGVVPVSARENTHTHTVCVPYYKATPYNISHT